MGERSLRPEEVIGVSAHTDLVAQVNGIIDYCHSLGLYGYAGVDFFCVKNSSGDIELFMTELNGRIPISGTAAIMARKLGAPAWINIDAKLWSPLHR